jgi:hypothetical protein
MEEIKDKAFDDELNKAEDRIEGRVDKTPLPPHRSKKEKENKKEEDGEN